jgi:hypothetical protein
MNILNVALNVGELEFKPLMSTIPEVTHAGFPSFPFCRLAIVPSTLSGLLCALAIDSRELVFKDAIVIVVITIATNTGIVFVGLLLLVILILEPKQSLILYNI